MNRPLWQRWLIAAMAFALIAGLLTWLMPGGGKFDLQLADGRAVSVLQTTYGTRHVYEEGSFLAKWVAKLAGPAQAQRFGFRSHSTTTPAPGIVVWTEWMKSISNRSPRYASLREVSGFETEPVFLTMEFSPADQSRSILAWHFDNFPRRAESFEMRFHDRTPPYRPDPLDPVLVRNDARANPPPLGGAEPPISVVEDGTTFTLVKLSSGEPLPPWRRGTESGLAPWTTATFEVKEGGRVSTNWTIRRIAGTGATSNSFTALYPKVAIKDGRLTPGFVNVLWPDEPDWNLAVEFVRDRGFAPEDLWTLRSVPTTRTNAMFTTNFPAAIQGGVQAGLSLQPAGMLSGADGGYLRTTDLGLSFTSLVSNLRVELARAVDNRGRELRFGNGVYLWPFAGPSGRYLAGLELAADTESVDLTFAFQQPRRIEFKVKPAYVRTNFSWTFPAPGK